MTASIYSAKVLRSNLKRYDTDDGWVIAGSDVDVAAASSGFRCGSPVRDTWTILTEGLKSVEMSYRTALAATPSTTCGTPEMRSEASPEITKTPSRSLRSVVNGSVLSVKSSKKKTVVDPPSTTTAPSSDEDANMYQLRKGRVAGSGTNKSRHNKKK